MNPLQAAVERMSALRTEITELDAVESPTEEQVSRMATALTEWDTAKTEHDALAERARRVAEVAATVPVAPAVLSPVAGSGAVERSGNGLAAPNLIVQRDAFAVLTDPSVVGRARTVELRDSLLRANEGLIHEGDQQSHYEGILNRHLGRRAGESDQRWAEGLLARSRPEYTDGFLKLMMGDTVSLTDVERTAMSVGSNTNGGYLVPTHLDPTLILTNAGSSNALRSAGTRKVTLTQGSVWNGVTSAGVTASWDGELVEVSDDSPTMARVSITVYKGQAFVQASVEAFEDIASLQADVLMMFGDARDRLEGAAFATGSGSSQPKGLFTALNASSSLQVVSTTAATIGEVDIHALYRALPQRWRSRGEFVANPLYTLAVKRLGTAVSSSYSGDLTQPVSERWVGRPVVETDDAPTTQTTTALDQEIVYADLSQFIIVDKPGSTSIDFIPTMFNTANNLPDGRRGWHMWWRVGSDMPNLNAGRILVDKTSA